MLFIVIAALFSVCVSIALKLFKQANLNIFQILSFNYVSASVLSYVWLEPQFDSMHLTQSWGLILLLGILLPSVFWCLDRSLQYAGLIKTEIAQRLSVVLTLLVSAMIYQEHFSVLKLTGIGLGIIAVLCMLYGKKAQQVQQHSSTQIGLSILSVWIGYAVIDLLLKYTSSLGLQFALTLTLIFMVAALFSFIIAILKSVAWQRNSILAGLGLGLLNFANIAFYLKAHQWLKDSPAIVFAGMNILVVVFGIIAAVFIFKEKLNASKVLGGLLALVAVYCLMQSML